MAHKLRKLSGGVAAATVTMFANSFTPAGADVEVRVDTQPDSSCQISVRIDVTGGGETVVIEGAAPARHEAVGDTGPLLGDDGWAGGVDLDDGAVLVYWDTAALGEDGLEFDIIVDGVSVVVPVQIPTCEVSDSVARYRAFAAANPQAIAAPPANVASSSSPAAGAPPCVPPPPLASSFATLTPGAIVNCTPGISAMSSAGPGGGPFPVGP